MLYVSLAICHWSESESQKVIKNYKIKWNDEELSQDCKITSLLNCRYCKVLLFMCQFDLAILPTFYSGCCCECMFLDTGKWKSLSHARIFATLYGLYSPWNSLGQNTGVSSLSLLQGIFPTQQLNPGLLHFRRIPYELSYKGSPRILGWLKYWKDWRQEEKGTSEDEMARWHHRLNGHEFE